MTIVWLLLSSILWGALVVGASAAIQSGLKMSGSTQQWLWRAASLLLILPWLAAPFATLLPRIPVGLPEMTPDFPGRGLDVTVTAAPIVEASFSTPHLDLPWADIVAVVLVAGWIWRLVAAHRARTELRRVIAPSVAVAQGPAAAAVRVWSQRLSLKRHPELRLTDASVSPFSFGVMRPVICLPKDIEARLSHSALNLIVAHECLHVARGDGWLRPLERMTADVLWFNPFAWRIRRELDLARELACDEAVLEQSVEPATYARVLRDVAGLVAGLGSAAPATSMSLSGGGRVLSFRMKRTLGYASRIPGRLAFGAVALLLVVGAPMAVAQAILSGPPSPPPPVTAPVAPPPAPPAPPAAPAPPAPPAPAGSSVDGVAPPAPPAPVKPSVDAIAPLAPVSLIDDKVRAPFNAHVTKVAKDNKRGLYVVIDQVDDGKGFGASDARGCTLETPHLARARVKEGQTIAAGDVIGDSTSDWNGKTTVFCKTFDADRLPGPVATPAKYVAPPPVGLPGASAPVLLPPAHVSSPFGYRNDPFTHLAAWHEGVDIAASLGSSVQTPAAGKVTYAGPRPGLGNVVEISAGNNYTLRFAHLGALAVKEGERTNAGDSVGAIGMDDKSTGPHVHFEVFWKGHSYDPQTISGLVLIGAG